MQKAESGRRTRRPGAAINGGRRPAAHQGDGTRDCAYYFPARHALLVRLCVLRGSARDHFSFLQACPPRRAWPGLSSLVAFRAVALDYSVRYSTRSGSPAFLAALRLGV